MSLAAGENVLPRRATAQPRPMIYPHGDCGACALGGALGLSVEDLYAKFDTKGITNHGEMQRCLRCSVSHGLADRAIDVSAEFPGARYLRAFGSPGYLEYLAWFNHVRMAVDAGYYGIATIDMHGQHQPDTDHWVLLCGARSEGSPVGKVVTGEILVSCSVNGESWYEARDFLKRMGGYNVLFVRPRQ